MSVSDKFSPNQPMSIAVFIPTWKACSEAWAHRMLEILEPEIVIIVGEDIPETWRGIPCFSLNSTRPHPGFVERQIRKIRKRFSPPPTEIDRLRTVLSDKGVDTVLIHYANFAIKMRDVWHGIRNIYVHCHGVDVSIDGRSSEWPHAHIHAHDYSSQLLAIADQVQWIANSRHTEGVLVKLGISRERIHLKYFGVPLPPLRADPSEAADQSQPHLRCLCLGRMIDCKGPDLMIQSFLEAKSRGFSGSLVMAGDGPLLTACELLAARSEFAESITFLGEVNPEDTPEIYSSSDLFLSFHCTGPLTNRVEAFGVTLLEAMAHGLPVITAESGGVSDSVQDGETGYFISPGDTDEFADRLLALDQDRNELHRLSMNARQHVEDHFSLEAERAQLVRILQIDEGV